MSDSTDTTVKSIDPTEAIEAAKVEAAKPAEAPKVEVAAAPAETANVEAPATTTPKPVIVSQPKPKPVVVEKTPVTTTAKVAEVPRAQKYMTDYIARYLSINKALAQHVLFGNNSNSIISILPKLVPAIFFQQEIRKCILICF